MSQKEDENRRYILKVEWDMTHQPQLQDDARPYFLPLPEDWMAHKHTDTSIIERRNRRMWERSPELGNIKVARKLQDIGEL
jgi:hypothetical protein